MSDERKSKFVHPYRGKLLSMKEISRLPRAVKAGLTYATLNSRINRGKMTVEQALSKPLEKNKGAKPTREWRQMKRKAIEGTRLKQVMASL